jgi:6-phosphogluconolactonase
MRKFLVGTYTSNRASRGLYLCALHERARVDVLGVVETDDPSFVVVHPRLPLAYVVNELPKQDGAVSVIALEEDRMAVRQRVESRGGAPCHLAFVDDARTLAVAQYNGGTVAWFDVDANGRLATQPRLTQHVGSSVHLGRQASAHPHCAVVGGDSVYVADLGLDAIVQYDAAAKNERSRCSIHAGAGPRHLCLDVGAGHGWLVNEIDSTVSRLSIDGDGRLVECDWVRTLPAEFDGRNAGSEIARHPNGATLYVGNRGHDSIAYFSIGASGVLRFGGAVATRGAHPRHFALTADGATLIVANRDSDSLAVFDVDASGPPTPIGEPFTGVPAPVFVRWL